MMTTFAEERFYHLHGEEGARLNRNQSIFRSKPQSWFIKIWSPLCLFVPGLYLDKLCDTSVDCLVNENSWKKMLTQLADEWTTSTLLSTVLLPTNVGFLAIQTVDERSHSWAKRSSYISLVTSMGSIILGLLLARQHRTTLNRGFLARRGVSRLGLESLAVLYSLPYSLLMWAVTSFLAAFSFMCYVTGDKITYALISFAWASLVMFVLWCISTSFEKEPYLDLLIFRLWSSQREKFRTWIGGRDQTDAEQDLSRHSTISRYWIRSWFL